MNEDDDFILILALVGIVFLTGAIVVMSIMVIGAKLLQ